MDEESKLIGELIKKRRIEIGLTLEELALASGYKSKTTLQKIEKGTRGIPLSKVPQIANALNVDVSYFFGYDDIPADNGTNVIVEYYNRLSDDDKVMALNYMRFLAQDKGE